MTENKYREMAKGIVDGFMFDGGVVGVACNGTQDIVNRIATALESVAREKDSEIVLWKDRVVPSQEKQIIALEKQLSEKEARIKELELLLHKEMELASNLSDNRDHTKAVLKIKSLEAEIAELRKQMFDMKLLPNQGHCCDGFCLGTCLEGTRLSQKLSDLEKEQDILVTTYEQKLEKAVGALNEHTECLRDCPMCKALKDLTSEEEK